jgi:hypothetical protein
LEPPRGRRRVNRLAECHEGDAERLKFIEQQDEVPEIPTHAIEAPTYDDIDLAPPRILQQRIKCRPAILRSADAAIRVFDGAPAARLGEPPQFDRLVLGVLIERADSCVDRSLHRISGLRRVRNAALPLRQVTMISIARITPVETIAISERSAIVMSAWSYVCSALRDTRPVFDRAEVIEAA